MATEPTDSTTIQFIGPVENVFTSSGSMHITFSDGGQQTIRFLAPRCPTQIVGREIQLKHLKQRLFETGQIGEIALIGLPGMGKTTLATLLAWDREVLGHFTSGVLWASLGPHGDPDAQLNLWAQTLDVDLSKEPMLDARIAKVQAALQGQPFLIVLDDVWNEDQIDILSQITGPGCVLLLTTRNENVARAFTAPNNILRIGELSEAQAVQLLGELCPQVREHTAELSHLARAVGGLPLALSLMGRYLISHDTFAGERSQALEVLMQVEDRLGLRDRNRRMTLQQIIALSVQALPDEKSRLAFTRLGVFAPKPTSFSLTAAQEVTEANLATLGTLVRRGLLEKVDEERITIHQSLADVAAAALPPGDAAAKHHADYYLALLKNRRTLFELKDDQLNWGPFALELPQIRHAWNALPDENAARVLEFVVAIKWLLRFQVLGREQFSWLERGLRAAQVLGHEEQRAGILSELGSAHLTMEELQRALDYKMQALTIYEALNDQGGQAMILNDLGMVYSELGDAQQALKYLSQALQLKEGIAPDFGDGIMLYNIGRLYHEREDHKQSLVYMMEALTFLKTEQNIQGMAGLCQYLGGMSNTLGEHRWALRWLEEALDLQEALADRSGSAETYRLMGDVNNNLGYQDQAQKYYMKAQALLETVDNPAKRAEMNRKLGVASFERGDYQQALEYFHQALPFSESVNDRRRQVQILLLMGRAYQALNKLPQAQQSYERALALHDSEDETRGNLLRKIGEVFHAREEWQKALDYYMQASSVCKAAGDQAELSTALHNIGNLHNDQGKYFRGLKYLEQALALRLTLGWLTAERLTLLSMSVSYYHLADWIECERVLTRVVELSKTLNDPELELDRSQLEQVRAWRRQTGM